MPPKRQTTDSASRAASDAPTRAPAIPRLARIATLIALVLAAAHVFLTAVYNTPYEDAKYGALPGRMADNYISPYLVQDYRIFAPNPANSDRNLWVRAWVETPEGERVETEWVDATSIELAEPHRRVLRKQLTVLGAERLMGAYNGLTDAQREVVEQNFHNDSDLTPLRDALVAADTSNAAAVNDFIRVTNYVTSYATQVAHAMWGDENEVIAVQTRSVYSPVVRWEERFDDDAQRPSSSYTALGWRPLMEWSAQDRDAFARSFLTWAERAGVSAELDTTGADEVGDQTANAESDDGGAGGEE